MCKLNYFCCLDINIYNKAFIRQLLATISCECTGFFFVNILICQKIESKTRFTVNI